MKILKMCFTSIFLTAVSFPVLAAQFVVVGVEGATPVGLGDVVDDAKPIKLDAGTALTLINANGQKLKLVGPHSGSVGGNTASATTTSAGTARPKANYDVVKSLAGLFKSRRNSKSLGAFRAALVKAPGTWMYNVASEADYCLDAGQKPRLWRESARKKAVVKLTTEDGSTSKSLVWKKGKSILSWPSAVPFESGSTYKTKVGKKGKEQTFSVHMVPDGLPSRAHQAAWMIENGCGEQARLLIVSTDIDHTVQSQN